MGRKWTEDSHLFRTFCAATNCDKLSGTAFPAYRMQYGSVVVRAEPQKGKQKDIVCFW